MHEQHNAEYTFAPQRFNNGTLFLLAHQSEVMSKRGPKPKVSLELVWWYLCRESIQVIQPTAGHPSIRET